MVWAILLLLQLCVVQPAQPSPLTPARIRPLVQFPNLTWVENIAVRPNGQLLVTVFSSPKVYQISPFQPKPTAKLVATFPQALGTLGIAEIEDDVFAITKGNFSSASGDVTPRSFSVWKADFRNHDTPVLSSLVDVPDATILNGATTVKKGSKILLSADSMAGVIWRINLETAKYDVILNETSTQPLAPYPAGWGANGVHTRDGHLFFTNSDKGYFRVPIHDDGTPAGDVELISNVKGGDDFSFDKLGNAFVAAGRFDNITKVTPAGETTPLEYVNADAQVLIEGNTATAFGRTGCDRSTLYVTTNGGWSGLVPGTDIQGGRVLAIDLGGYA